MTPKIKFTLNEGKGSPFPFQISSALVKAKPEWEEFKDLPSPIIGFKTKQKAVKYLDKLRKEIKE